ncbi:hypothetical protein NQ315_009730 [Exocentrus adspersus]|uniref:Kinesin-like protein KIF16B n=1 Tax=Exocentrus adspersus TaxID=1586481 RepID=A0AAV8WHP1_9CUCU|nr:hypothetical protein NQ315_009730 [Exocentrus adspersus]
MIAAISPADCNYAETLSTLRYANRAKNIINQPTVNEDPNVTLIRELRAEISKLRALMFCEQRSDMLAQLHEKEAREKELTEEWAGKWREAQAILREQRALGLRKDGPGVVLDCDNPHLVAINDDPLSTGVKLYHLKEGKITFGTEDAEVKQDIELKGVGIEPEHCTITFENGVATLEPHPGAHVMLNNVLLETPARLSQGCIIFLGKSHVFRFNDPAEAAELRKGEKTYNLSRLSLLSWSSPDLAVSMENLQLSVDEDKNEMEVQRLNLEKDKVQFEREQEAFEKRQEAFEKRRRTLEEAQAKLEAEKQVMKTEHAEQTRQLQEDWQNLTTQQRSREMELQKRENELIIEREELERKRRTILGDISQECETLQSVRAEFVKQFRNACQLVTANANDIIFPNPQAKRLFQELVSKSETTALTDNETDSLVNILNNVKGSSIIQDLINQHRKELAELQVELNKRVQALCERQKSVELLDRKIIDLVDEQKGLRTEESADDQLENLRESLSKRTEDELKKIEQRKQGYVRSLIENRCYDSYPVFSLTLNLPKVNSVQSPGSIEKGTLSSDTYHTAPSSCSPILNNGNKLDYLMSDSGVELRPSSMPQEESDLSSNEDKVVVSDSQSTSSVENHSPVIKKNKKRETELLLRRLAQKITQQKQLIVNNLDNQSSKVQIDSQIAVLQELQRQYMSLKYGCTSSLSPTTEHPLQDNDSPSPIRPLHTGSMSALYSPSLHNPRLSSYNQSLYRSMPSITTDTDCDSIVSITSYCLRGAGRKTHYEYEVRIYTVDDRWCILRRYSRFRDLHIAMKARYREKVSSIPFPSKILFSNTESVAQSRKRQLEMYLRRLIEICRSDPMCPLAYGGPITKTALINFSPFFRRGLFENGKHGTS